MFDWVEEYFRLFYTPEGYETWKAKIDDIGPWRSVHTGQQRLIHEIKHTTMEKNTFKIKADCMQDFKRFGEFANRFPEQIRKQVESVEAWFHGEPKLVFKKASGNHNKIALPSNLTHLSDSGAEIHALAPGVFITIPYEPGAMFQYEFVDTGILNK